jgi:hypothetical protein
MEQPENARVIGVTIASVAVVGTVVSLVFPSHRLPGIWDNISDALGYIYTFAWSYSFYPQFLLNLKRR